MAARWGVTPASGIQNNTDPGCNGVDRDEISARLERGRRRTLRACRPLLTTDRAAGLRSLGTSSLVMGMAYLGAGPP